MFRSTKFFSASEHLALLLAMRPPSLADIDHDPAPAFRDDMSVQGSAEEAE